MFCFHICQQFHIERKSTEIGGGEARGCEESVPVLPSSSFPVVTAASRHPGFLAPPSTSSSLSHGRFLGKVYASTVFLLFFLCESTKL